MTNFFFTPAMLQTAKDIASLGSTIAKDLGLTKAETRAMYVALFDAAGIPNGIIPPRQDEPAPSDPWVLRLLDYANGRETVRIWKFLEEVVGIPEAEQTVAQRLRVAKLLNSEGFMCKLEQFNGGIARVYWRRDADCIHKKD